MHKVRSAPTGLARAATRVAPSRRRFSGASVQSLETRTLFSVIAWTNRGTTDNFGVYGAKAPLARAIVDRAIGDWESVINSFNFTGIANGTNYYALALSATDLGSNGERGQATPLTVDTAKRPTSATVKIDDDGGGFGWYFDPAVSTASGLPDDGEFTSLQTPFAGSIPLSSASDFYRTVTHEIGHALGLSLAGGLRMADLYATRTPTPDPFDTSNYLWTINWDGGAPDATFSGNGGGHLFEGPSPAGTSYPTHPNDLMNSGRTVPTSPTLRELISDTDATILANVYGYSVTLPSTIHTLHASMNGTVLAVNGTAVNDQITVAYDGPNIDVSVNGYQATFPVSGITSVEIRAAGGSDNVTVSDVRNGNATTYTIDGTTVLKPGQPTINLVDLGGVDAVTLAAGGGASNVYVRSLGAFALTVDTGGGDDNLFLGNTAGAMASFTGAISFRGDIGNDHVWVTDSARGYAQTYTLTAATLTTSEGIGFNLAYDANVEGVHLYGPNVASTYNLRTTGAPTTINGGDGDDVFNLGNAGNLVGLVDPITVNAGGGGSDRIVFDDSANTLYSSYIMTGRSLSRSGLPTVIYDAEMVELHAGTGNDQIGIGDTVAGTLTSIYGGAGDDQLVVGYISFLAPSLLDPIDGSIFFDGQGGTADEVDLEDLAATAGRSYSLSATTLAASGMASITITNEEQVNLDAGGAADTIVVRPSTAVGFRVNGAANGDGSDRLVVSSIGSLVPTKVASTATSGSYTLAGYKPVAYSNVEAFGAPALTVTAAGTIPDRYPFAYTFTFSDDVSASLSAGDVTLVNLATNQTYTPGTVTWDTATRTATFTLATQPADGNYRVRLLASGVTSTLGGQLAADYTFDTFYLAGDITHDRKVDFADLLALARSYGLSGRTFSQGNVDYSADGKVDFSDLLLLARNYGHTLAMPLATFPVVQSSTDATASRRRPVADVVA